MKTFLKILLIILISIFIIIGIISCVISISQEIPNDCSKTFVENLINTDYSALSDGFAGLSWSIVGVFLLCLTMYYQRQDYKDSKLTNNKQRFETTFFNMLSMLIQLRNELKSSNPRGANGYDYLNECISEIKRSYASILESKPELKEIEGKISDNKDITLIELDCLKEEVISVYETFYKTNHASLGHYFRYIYHMVEFVLQERTAEKDRETYLGIIQSQLSDNELSLIFYNCLSKYARKKQTREPRFYNILDKYGFLENVDADSLLSRNHHILYPKTKFKFLNADEMNNRG